MYMYLGTISMFGEDARVLIRDLTLESHPSPFLSVVVVAFSSVSGDPDGFYSNTAIVSMGFSDKTAHLQYDP